MYVRLSFDLRLSTPTPGGVQPLVLRARESIEAGDVSNTFYYTAWNHAGTHVDAPAHMLAHGERVTDLPIGHFIFQSPYLLELTKGDFELIRPEDLHSCEERIAATDLLMLRTGFVRYRDNEPARYQDRNPGLSLAAAQYLTTPRFASLRAIGIDAISVATPAHVNEGIQAHRALFSRQTGPPILLVEDMDLRPDLSEVRRVFVVPLYVEGLDSAPCTVIAEISS